MKAMHAFVGRAFTCLVMLVVAVVLLPGATSAAPVFFPVAGFEDDVDLIVAANREFLVVPVEREDGTSASLQIFDLDPVTGNVVGAGPATNLALPAPYGWENGVDPIAFAIGITQIVVAPMESEDGSLARVVVMQVGNNGVVLVAVVIDLGDLGFEDGLDPVLINYGDQGVIVPLEKEDGSAAGILAININPGVGVFGRCTVIASDVRNTGCESDQVEPRLIGFLDSLDGVAYTLLDRSRFAIPIAREDGSGSDLAFFDWDFSTPFPAPPPVYLGSSSVKAINAPNARTLPFPGFEREVDIALVNGCGVGGIHPLLVPVENRSGGGDLYLVDGDTGVAVWRYDFDNPATAPRILGYEEAVDLVPWCNTGGPPDDLVAVSSENACGSDSDLLLVDMATGLFHKSLEAANPPLAMIGFEKGVEPLLWTATALLVPVDDEDGRANLLSIDKFAIVLDAVEDPLVNPSNVIFGFERSVDPIVMPLPNADRTLYVPVEKQDQSDANLMIFTTPPNFAVATRRNFEALNGVVVSGYERDVDATRVNRSDGYGFLYVAEQNPAHTNARLRIHDLPTALTPLLVLPTEGVGAVPSPNLYLVTPGGAMLQQNPDVLGYEFGLDPTSAIHDTLGWDPPSLTSPQRGFDAGGDNTLSMRNSYFNDIDGDGIGDGADCAPLEAGVWAPPVEVTGVKVDRVVSTGVTSIRWSSQATTVGAAACYDIATGFAADLTADDGFAQASCFADDLSGVSLPDLRPLADGAAYWYLVRAENLCGTGTWGNSNVVPDPRDQIDGALDPCP